jgi:hypothetical protein
MSFPDLGCDSTSSTVFYTIGGILCAFIIESLNLSIGKSRTVQQDGSSSSTDTPPGYRDFTPHARIKRLIYTTFFFIPLVTFFHLRVTNSCGDVDWTVMFFVGVIPLVTGTTAWLRALVDVLLVRIDRSLPYPSKDFPMKGSFGWPPFVPFYVLYLVIAVPVVLLATAGKAREPDCDLDIGLEEGERLLGSSDEQGIGGEALERPPPYRRKSEEEEGERQGEVVKTSD